MECYVSAKYLTDHLLPEPDWICYREWNTLFIILRKRKPSQPRRQGWHFQLKVIARVATFDTGTEPKAQSVNQRMILCWANWNAELISTWSFCSLLFSYLVNFLLPESQKPKCLQRVRKCPFPQHSIHFWYSCSIPTGCTAQYQRKGAILIIAVVTIKP